MWANSLATTIMLSKTTNRDNKGNFLNFTLNIYINFDRIFSFRDFRLCTNFIIKILQVDLIFY